MKLHQTNLRPPPFGARHSCRFNRQILEGVRIGLTLSAPITLKRAEARAPGQIGTLKQVSAETNVFILIGERLPVPNKVPEPVMVFVNAATGATNTLSLWR